MKLFAFVSISSLVCAAATPVSESPAARSLPLVSAAPEKLGFASVDDAVQRQYTECSTSSALLKLETVQFTPRRLQRGGPVNFQIVGTLSETITFGSKIQLSMKYLGFTLLDAEYDVCEQVANYGLKCPLDAGPFKLTQVASVPWIALPGTYVTNIKIHTPAGKEIACINSNLQV